MRTALGAVVVAVSALAGCNKLAYQCEAAADCIFDGKAGACEMTGYCSFPDPECPGGRRYGEWSGSFASACVGAQPMVDASVVPIDSRFLDAPIDAPPNALTLTFGETPTSTNTGVTADVELIPGSTTNADGYDHISVYSESGLYRWDVSAIPTSATVVSAHLEFETSGDGNVLGAGSVELYRMLETWDRSAATWFARDGGALWSDVGAGSPTSREATMFGSFSGQVEMRYTVLLPTAIAQSWISSPATNAGVILVPSSDATGHLHLGSVEGPPAKAATLTITYLP